MTGSVAAFVTGGFGSFSSVGLFITDGFGNGAAPSVGGTVTAVFTVVPTVTATFTVER